MALAVHGVAQSGHRHQAVDDPAAQILLSHPDDVVGAEPIKVGARQAANFQRAPRAVRFEQTVRSEPRSSGCKELRGGGDLILERDRPSLVVLGTEIEVDNYRLKGLVQPVERLPKHQRVPVAGRTSLRNCDGRVAPPFVQPAVDEGQVGHSVDRRQRISAERLAFWEEPIVDVIGRNQQRPASQAGRRRSKKPRCSRERSFVLRSDEIESATRNGWDEQRGLDGASASDREPSLSRTHEGAPCLGRTDSRRTGNSWRPHSCGSDAAGCRARPPNQIPASC